MEWNEYKILAEKTLSTEFHCDKNDELLLHAVIGILTEMEELLENHSGSEDDVNRGEELADIFWYISIISRKYDIQIPPTVSSSIDNPFEICINIIKVTLKMLDFLKKKLYYNKAINEDLLTTYTNEVIALISVYASIYNIDIPSILETNIAKLKARYGDKFTSERAINRDLETERIILEGK